MATIENRIEKGIATLEAQLELWTAKLDEVLARANVAGQQAKIESQQQLDELKHKLVNARAKLDEARAAGGDKWETLKEGMERAWKDLEATFKKVIN